MATDYTVKTWNKDQKPRDVIYSMKAEHLTYTHDSPCVLSSFLLCWFWLFFIFSSLPSLFRFRFGHRLFHPVFFSRVLCCLLGFGSCYSFSIWYIYIYVSWYTWYRCILIRTYADLTFLFLSEVYDVFQLLCLIFCFYLFSTWDNLPLQSYWRLCCDHGLHCSHEFMWEQHDKRRKKKNETNIDTARSLQHVQFTWWLGLVVRCPENFTDFHWAVEIWPDFILTSPTLGAHTPNEG